MTALLGATVDEPTEQAAPGTIAAARPRLRRAATGWPAWPGGSGWPWS